MTIFHASRVSKVNHHSCRICEQEEQLASTDDESSEEDDEGGARPEDKENLSPNRSGRQASDQASQGKSQAEGPRSHKGRKRKRQTSEGPIVAARDVAAARRLRIRQYYNGATHSSASAVQLFAMAMQVGVSTAACSPLCFYCIEERVLV